MSGRGWEGGGLAAGGWAGGSVKTRLRPGSDRAAGDAAAPGADRKSKNPPMCAACSAAGLLQVLRGLALVRGHQWGGHMGINDDAVTWASSPGVCGSTPRARALAEEKDDRGQPTVEILEILLKPFSTLRASPCSDGSSHSGRGPRSAAHGAPM